jgi:hypothetical protein
MEINNEVAYSYCSVFQPYFMCELVRVLIVAHLTIYLVNTFYKER